MIETVAGTRQLRVTVPMTMTNAATLQTQGEALLLASNGEVDLAAVHELDSSALSVIFAWQRYLAGQGGAVSLRLLQAPANLKSLAELYDVVELVPLA